MVTHILITNLSYVIINKVRMHVSAILMTEDDTDSSWRQISGEKVRREIRGFGPDPAWSVFDMKLPSIAYTLLDARSPHIISTRKTKKHPAGFKPLSSGTIMQIEGGPEISLIAEDADEPICFETFPGDTIEDVWYELPRKAAKYWRAPNMPVLQWASTQWKRLSR